MGSRKWRGTDDEQGQVYVAILKMKDGMLPIELDLHEIKLLKKVIGLDWFNYLGYSEPEFKKP